MCPTKENNIQGVNIPSTGKAMKVRTYTGKELFWREAKAKHVTTDEYQKLWEDDRL